MSNVSPPDVSRASWKELLVLADENPQSTDVASLLQERHVKLVRQRAPAKLETKQSGSPKPTSVEDFQSQARVLLEEMAIDSWLPKVEATMVAKGAQQAVLNVMRTITKTFVNRSLNDMIGPKIEAVPSTRVWVWDQTIKKGIPESFLDELSRAIPESTKTAIPETTKQRSPLSWANPALAAKDGIQARGTPKEVPRQLGRAEQRSSGATASASASSEPRPQAAASQSPPTRPLPYASPLGPLTRERLGTAPAAVTLRSKRPLRILGAKVRGSIFGGRKKPPSDGLPADPMEPKQSKSRGKTSASKLRGKTSVPVIPDPPTPKREPSPPSPPKRGDVSTSSVTHTPEQPSGKPSVVPESSRSRPDRSRPRGQTSQGQTSQGQTSQGQTSQGKTLQGQTSTSMVPPPPPPFKPSGKPSLRPKPLVSVLPPMLPQAKVPAPPKPPEERASESSEEVSSASTFQQELQKKRTLIRTLAFQKEMKESKQNRREKPPEDSEENSSYTSEEDVSRKSRDSSDTSDTSEDRDVLNDEKDVRTQQGRSTAQGKSTTEDFQELMSKRRGRMVSNAGDLDRIQRKSPRRVDVGFEFSAEEVEKYKSQDPKAQAALKSQALRDKKIDEKTPDKDSKGMLRIFDDAFKRNKVPTTGSSDGSSDESSGKFSDENSF